MTLLLASASPRRRELLRAAGIAFDVQPTDIPEIPGKGEAPGAFVERLARAKAMTVAAQHPGAWVLGADTTVVAENEILNKPADAQDAARMLRKLSGCWHEVITGVALVRVGSTPEQLIESEITRVQFSPLTEQDIAFYVSTGEPMDKAGAYAIQGIASRWIPRIEGDYSNVVGLPVARVWRMLQQR